MGEVQAVVQAALCRLWLGVISGVTSKVRDQLIDPEVRPQSPDRRSGMSSLRKHGWERAMQLECESMLTMLRGLGFLF